MKRQLLVVCSICCLFAINMNAQNNTTVEDPDFVNFELDSLLAQMDDNGRPWLPFQKGKNVLTGIYRLKAGATDQQQPHNTDEVYYVIAGKAKFTAAEKTIDVQAGSILFVKAAIEHQFSEIEEELIILVFFDQ